MQELMVPMTASAGAPSVIRTVQPARVIHRPILWPSLLVTRIGPLWRITTLLNVIGSTAVTYCFHPLSGVGNGVCHTIAFELEPAVIGLHVSHGGQFQCDCG